MVVWMKLGMFVTSMFGCTAIWNKHAIWNKQLFGTNMLMFHICVCKFARRSKRGGLIILFFCSLNRLYWSGRYIEKYMQYLEQMRLFHAYNFKWMFLVLSHSCFLMQSSLSPGSNSENFLLVTKWTIQNLLTKIPDFCNLFVVVN